MGPDTGRAWRHLKAAVAGLAAAALWAGPVLAIDIEAADGGEATDPVAAGEAAGPAATGTGTTVAVPQDAPGLTADRPGFTEPPDVLPRGLLQFESGLQCARADDAVLRTTSLTTPQALVRLGLGSRIEARVAADGLVSQSWRDGGARRSVTGGSDLVVGLKYAMTRAPHRGVTLALLPFLSMPTGHAAVTSGGWDPGVTLAWAREVAAGFELSGNVNAAAATEDGARRLERAASVSLGRAFGPAWGAYWEAWGASTGHGTDLVLESGLARTLGTDMQVDVGVGKGMAGGADDWFVGVGFVIRHRPR